MFCTYTHETHTFHSEMRAPTYWAEAVTKRGGRAPPLNVQLFDPLEPGYKRMLSGELQHTQSWMVASCYIGVGKATPKQFTVKTVCILSFRTSTGGQSQLASQLAGELTVMQLRSRCWLSGAPRSLKPWPCWNKWALCWRAYTIVCAQYLRNKHIFSPQKSR